MGRKETIIGLPVFSFTTEQILNLPIDCDSFSMFMDVNFVTGTPVLSFNIEEFFINLNAWIGHANLTQAAFAPTGAQEFRLLWGEATNVAEQYDFHVSRLALGKQMRLRIGVADTDICNYSIDGHAKWLG